MPPRTASCSVGSVDLDALQPGERGRRAQVLELVAGRERHLVEAVPQEVGVGAHPALEVRCLEQRAAELALDQPAHHQRPDDQEHLVHGAPERIRLRPRIAPGLDERLVAPRRLEQAVEEGGAGLGVLGQGAADVVAQDRLAAQQRGRRPRRAPRAARRPRPSIGTSASASSMRSHDRLVDRVAEPLLRAEVVDDEAGGDAGRLARPPAARWRRRRRPRRARAPLRGCAPCR